MAATTIGDPNQQKPLPGSSDPLAPYVGRTLTGGEANQAAQALGMRANAGGDYFSNVNNGQAANSAYNWSNTGQGWSLQPNAPTNTTTTTAPAATATPAPITTQQDVLNTPTTAGAPNPQPTTVAQSFQQSLVNLLNPSIASPVNASNPAIAPAIQANQLAGQRGLEQQRNTLAEQAAANGTSNSGGFDSVLSGLIANNANQQGQFAGSAVQHLSDQNNSNLLSALGLGSGLLSGQAGLSQQGTEFGQTLAEQQRQANMDNALKQLGITSTTQLGQGDLNLRLLLGLAGLGQQANIFGQSNDSNTLASLLGMA
jgi:hypothetical protein